MQEIDNAMINISIIYKIRNNGFQELIFLCTKGEKYLKQNKTKRNIRRMEKERLRVDISKWDIVRSKILIRNCSIPLFYRLRSYFSKRIFRNMTKWKENILYFAIVGEDFDFLERSRESLPGVRIWQLTNGEWNGQDIIPLLTRDFLVSTYVRETLDHSLSVIVRTQKFYHRQHPNAFYDDDF